MSALKNTAAALALGLALPGGALAACDSGLAELKTSYASGRVNTVLAALNGVTSDPSCTRVQIVAARRQAASVVAGYSQKLLAEGRVNDAEAIIVQAPALHWAVQAVRGDIAARRGNRDEAAALYNDAMDTLSDPSLTQQTPKLAPVAKRLASLAQENMMLAGTSETSLKRGGDASGVLRFVARGLAVERVGKKVDPYKADDYAVKPANEYVPPKPKPVDEYAVKKVDDYVPPKEDEYAVKKVDDYVQPKNEDYAVKKVDDYVPPKVVYKKEDVKVYVPPKKDDYAIIDDTYKDIGAIFLPIKFATNSASLDHAGFKEAERLAEFLNKHRVEKLTIEGHTDDVGGHEFNFDLSLRRARTLADFLVSYGVHSRIHVVGKGETEPPFYTDRSIYSIDELRTIARRVEVSFGY